jgi:subtilisin family serine protease
MFIAKTFAQEYSKGIFYVKVENDESKPSKTKGRFVNHDRINKMFEKHKVTLYEQAFPYSKDTELLKIYRVKFSDDNSSFKKDLESDPEGHFKSVREIRKPKRCYAPSDYMYYLTLNDNPSGWLWYLNKIQANYAWEITKGSPSVKVGIVDTDFDLNHPDLATKIYPNTDPRTGVVHSARGESHGTAVASFCAAQTDGGGQLASVGFNTMMECYTWDEGEAKAHYASIVRNVPIISISWYNACSSVDDDTKRLIREILDHGTIIVAASGNGTNDCNGGPILPFSPVIDDRIICVSGTEQNDNHYCVINGENKTESHYSQVTLCAPGYSLMEAVPTIKSDGTTNTWPYFSPANGSSFATPITAGAVALMKSIDPYLTPVRAKTILQSTCDEISDASNYPGLVGAGRLNVYKAVKMAGTKSLQGTTITSGSIFTFSAGYGAYLSNITIGSSANTKFTARKEISINGYLDVNQGSTFSLEIDPEAVNTNNW